MLTKLKLKNYKSFSDITWDFSKGKNKKNMAAIYGENGAGKSNILTPIFQLVESARSFSNQQRFIKFQKELSEKEKVDLKILKEIPIFKLTSVEEIFRNINLIGSSENTEITYEFCISEEEKITGKYKLIFSPNGQLIEEKLFSLVNKRNGLLFDIKFNEDKVTIEKLNSAAFRGRAFITLLRDRIDQFWGKHTFFAILEAIFEETNSELKDKSVSFVVREILEMILSIGFKTDQMTGLKNQKDFLRSLMYGSVKSTDKNKIVKTQKSLNLFFTSLYSDIKKVYYEVNEKENEIEYKLYVYKLIAGKIRKIPFTLESKGTKKLLELFPLFSAAMNGDIVVVDEIDSGIHDLLMSKLLENFQDYIKGQLIFSTHNTTLLKVLPANEVYVIQEDIDGNKQIASFSEVANIKPNNNLQKLYLSGYFSGVPFADDIDFDEIFKLEGK